MGELEDRQQLPTGNWVKVTVNLSGTVGILYVDGTAVGSNPNLQLALEVYHFSQPLVHQTSGGQAVGRANMVAGLIAVSYQVKPNLVFDTGFSHGFTSTTTRWQSFAGLTYLLPHRLWPEHKTRS